jgi:ABC-type uncharacterized transport system permease subunit
MAYGFSYGNKIISTQISPELLRGFPFVFSPFNNSLQKSFPQGFLFLLDLISLHFFYKVENYPAPE